MQFRTCLARLVSDASSPPRWLDIQPRRKLVGVVAAIARLRYGGQGVALARHGLVVHLPRTQLAQTVAAIAMAAAVGTERLAARGAGAASRLCDASEVRRSER